MLEMSDLDDEILAELKTSNAALKLLVRRGGNGMNKLKWLAGSIGVPAMVGTAWFLFAHFAEASDTAERSKQNEAIVSELQAIRVNQASAEEAEFKLTKTLCLAGKLKDRDICAGVGVGVEVE